MDGQIAAKLLRLGMVILCVAGGWISAEFVKEAAGPWPSAEQGAGEPNGLCGAGANGEAGGTEGR